MERAAAVARLRAARASDLWGYLAFSHGWTWLWWSVNVVGGYEAFGAGLPFTVLGGAGPLLGGLVMSYVTYGRRGLADLRRRLTDLRRIPPRWGLVALAFFPAFAAATGAIAALLAETRFVLEVGELRALLRDPSALLVTALVILVVGPLPEEIGWRGYLLDRCQVRWSAAASGLAVGVVWAAWHAPLFVMPGYFETFDFAPDPTLFAANVVLVSVVYTWLYDNTARSVLALIAFHFLENFVGQVTALPPAAEPVGTGLRALVVLAVVAWFGPETLRRDGSIPPPPPASERPAGGPEAAREGR
jgi:membrane protease YdiL (CAAX protease family)